MKKSICFLIGIFLSFSFWFASFTLYGFDSSAAEVALPSMLWNSYAISSEYFANRAGKIINNANTSDVISLDGNNYAISNDYAFALNENFGWDGGAFLNPFTNYDRIGKKISVGSNIYMNLLKQVVNTQIDDYTDFVNNYDLFQIDTDYGALYYATDKQGAFAGTSYDNIVSWFKSTESTASMDYVTSLATKYPSYNVFSSKNILCGGYKPNGNNYANLNLYFSNPVYCYTDGVNAFGFPDLKFVCASSVYSSIIINALLSYDGNQYNPTIEKKVLVQNLTINGILYKCFSIQLLNIVNNNYYRFTPYYSETFSSLNDIINFLSDFTTTDVPPYEANLIDSSSVPYVVPDTGELAIPISDVFPVCDTLSDGTAIPIPDVNTGVRDIALPIDITDEIADIIDDVISKVIAVPIAVDDDLPPPDPDDPIPDEPIPIPDWIVPQFIPDLFPTDLFEIFEPIFDIVGDTYSMFDTWMLIPSIVVFIFILYIIISVL